jgi:hypothetical protein
MQLIPGFVLWGLTAYSIAAYVEKERLYWKKVSRPLESNNYFVAGYNIFYGCLALPIVSIINSIIAYYLAYYLEFTKVVSMGVGLTLLIAQPFYAYLFVNIYDKFTDNCAKAKFIALKLFKHESYVYFLSAQSSLRGAIKQIVREMEENVQNDEYPEL